MTVNLKIAKAYFILISASILGHILGMGKEILVANYFGITKAMDAFYSALTVPNLISPIFSSPFLLVFIPIFIKYKLQDRENANWIASIVINYIFIFLLTASIIVFAFAPQIIKYGFSGLDSGTGILATKILRISSVSIIFLSLVNIMSAILNAYENFSIPAFSQMSVTVCIILFILLFAKQWGIFVFVWGMVIGLLIQFVFLIIPASIKGYRHHLNFDWKQPVIRKTLNLAFILFLLGIISGINPVINRMMASWLPSGSIAALAYADKLVQVPVIIFSGSIATAVFPFFSAQIAENKIEEMKDTLAISIKMTGFIFIPLSIIMIVLAKPTIQLLFQRGAFDARATDLTSKIFICYSLQLFSIYAMVIMHRIFFIFQDMSSIFKIIVIGVILNIILNLIFMKIINPPAAGIALSSSVGCFVITILHFVFLKKRIHYLHGLSILKSLIKITFLAAILGIIIFVVFQKLNNLIISPSIFNQIVKIAGSAGTGMIVFIGMAFLFKTEEAEKIYAVVKNKTRDIF